MKKNSYSGKFIVFEGLDGSGQSTQADFLRDFFIQEGHRVVLTKEPTQDSKAGKKIRKILEKKEKIAPDKLQRLFAKDREWHLKKIIIPALKKGKIVISDRYFFSTIAYGASEGLNLDWLIGLNNNFLFPDLTLILKVNPKICVSRIAKRGIATTLFEKEKKLTKVWQTYKVLPRKFKNIYPVRKYGIKKKTREENLDFSNGVYIIDGEKTIKEVFSRIKDLIKSKLNF